MASSRNSLSFLLFVIIAAATVDCNSEGEVLTAWRLKLVDPNNVLQSWDPTLVNPCTWFHVTCNSQNSVIRLDLGNANLSGPLIPELGNLSNLQYFYVYGNNISGVIPWEMGRLSNLRVLSLHHNKLSESIPNSLGNLTSLWFLEVHDNFLSGFIPSSLGSLTSLRILRLDNNRFSGNLPLTVLQLVRSGNLNLLNVSRNSLTGSVRAANSSEFAVTTIIQDPKTHK